MKHPHNRKGAKRVLDYDQIRRRLVSGERTVDIANEVGCSQGHITRLKKRWGLVKSRWEVG